MQETEVDPTTEGSSAASYNILAAVVSPNEASEAMVTLLPKKFSLS